MLEMPDRPEASFKIGETFSKDVTFDRDAVVAFATMAGDLNPLHHDEDFAKASQFKGLIASGTHTSALMLGALATYLSARTAVVGLGYSMKMKKAVRAGEAATITWEVVGIEWKESLGGDIVTFEGTLRNSEGAVAISASCANLVFARGSEPAASFRN